MQGFEEVSGLGDAVAAAGADGGAVSSKKRELPEVFFYEKDINSPLGRLVGYIPNDLTRGQMLQASGAGPPPGQDVATCELQFATFRNFVSLSYINMGPFKGKSLCKHLFRETLKRLIETEDEDRRRGKTSITLDLFRIDVQGGAAATVEERARALNCYNTVLEEFGYSHTMGGLDAQPLDPNIVGYRYWKRR